MLGPDLSTDDNPYGLPLQDDPRGSQSAFPQETPPDDPYYPDPYA